MFGEIRNGKAHLNEFGEIAYKEWINTGKIRSNVELDQFVVMPNHLHDIIILDKVIGSKGMARHALTGETRQFGNPFQDHYRQLLVRLNLRQQNKFIKPNRASPSGIGIIMST